MSEMTQFISEPVIFISSIPFTGSKMAVVKTSGSSVFCLPAFGVVLLNVLPPAVF